MGNAKILFGQTAAGLHVPLAVDSDGKLQTSGGGGVTSGSTFPASPTTGQLFLHTPTGRSILYEYSGTAWVPITSLGAMTLYVDSTDGTDDLDHGTGVDADAFATIQYAVDCIPGLVGGNVTININGETYAEDVTIQGKSLTGNYTIKLQGTLSASKTGTIGAGSVQGTGATQGTLVDNTGGMTVNAYENKLIYEGTTNGAYRLIDSNTATTFTIAGTWPTGAPVNGNAYTVYDWATTIDALYIKSGQVGVEVYDIIYQPVGLGGLYETVERDAKASFYRCKILPDPNHYNYGYALLDTCYGYGDTANHDVIAVRKGGGADIRRSKLCFANTDGKIVYVEGAAVVFIQAGTILDGTAGAAEVTYGLDVEGNAFAYVWDLAANGYPRIRDCDTGVFAFTGGQVLGTAVVQYSGNTTNESAHAASYGYID